MRTFLCAGDGVRIEARYEPARGGAVGAGGADALAIVVAHGFTGSVDRPAVRRAAGVFSQFGAVITFSFRGHGRSGGHSTVGDREVLDLAAAVGWARSLGHTRVVTVGFSMGGSVAVRHAALYGVNGAPGSRGGGRGARRSARGAHRSSHRRGRGGERPGALVLPGYGAHAALHWVVTRPAGRLVGRFGFRTRIHPREWDTVPLPPVEAAARLGATPLLVVHGDRDAYFPLDHPRMLADAAAGSGSGTGTGTGRGELWIEPGMGHAENTAGEALLTRIGVWLSEA
ncbi:alpha/beta hydrolase [Streptomyces hypolithicus]